MQKIIELTTDELIKLSKDIEHELARRQLLNGSVVLARSKEVLKHMEFTKKMESMGLIHANKFTTSGSIGGNLEQLKLFSSTFPYRK